MYFCILYQSHFFAALAARCSKSFAHHSIFARTQVCAAIEMLAAVVVNVHQAVVDSSSL